MFCTHGNPLFSRELISRFVQRSRDHRDYFLLVEWRAVPCGAGRPVFSHPLPRSCQFSWPIAFWLVRWICSWCRQEGQLAFEVTAKTFSLAGHPVTSATLPLKSKGLCMLESSLRFSSGH